MSETAASLAEQDATVARVAETSMRMMAGAVGPQTIRSAQELLKRHPDAYPWQEVCALVVAEPGDPSQLVNKAIVSQRDWLQRGGRSTAASPQRPRRSMSNAGKRLLARLIVRGGFYAVFAAVGVVILVLVRNRWGFDIYLAADRVVEAVRGLLG